MAESIPSMKDLPYHYGLKLRIYPSSAQKEIISCSAGASRFVYNRLVALDKEKYQLKKVGTYSKPIRDRLNYVTLLSTDMKELKNSIPFISSDDRIDGAVFDTAVSNYRKAWKNYRENPHTGIPTFHKKGYDFSYQTTNHYTAKSTGINDGSAYLIDKNHIQLPYIGKIRMSGSRKWIDFLLLTEMLGRIGTITISCDAVGRYYASLALAFAEPLTRQLDKTCKDIAFDVNLKNYLSDSDGNTVDNPHYKKDAQKKLSKAQRKMSRRAERAKKDSRKLENSKNYQQSRVKVAFLHDHVANQREDFLHNLSWNAVKNHDCIFVENLKVINMLKNHHLAYAISDVSWSRFFTMLEYKSGFYGRTFLRVPPMNTTQTCSKCGYVMKGDEHLDLSVREWTCPKCKTHHDRDTNAAVNVLIRGKKILKERLF